MKSKRYCQNSLAIPFFYLLGNFVEIVLVSKNAPRGLHCGGAENVAIATRRRRRMSQATFFILVSECRFCTKNVEKYT